MTVFGMMRIKNEARWIEQVIRSIMPICERVFVLDDSSTDGTPNICERLGDKVTVYRSPFEGLDEARDKSFLLERIMNNVSDVHLRGNLNSPFWVLAIDGDELMDSGGIDTIRGILPKTEHVAFRLPVIYLWDSMEYKRVDGVYKNFARPSLFRLINRAYRYQTTPWGGNLHCSSIPQELLHYAHETCNAPLLHLGYMYKEDRLRKYAFYNSVDPNNRGEDYYRHMVQGDVPEVPREARLMHAGPLRLERRVESVLDASRRVEPAC